MRVYPTPKAQSLSDGNWINSLRECRNLEKIFRHWRVLLGVFPFFVAPPWAVCIIQRNIPREMYFYLVCISVTKCRVFFVWMFLCVFYQWLALRFTLCTWWKKSFVLLVGSFSGAKTFMSHCLVLSFDSFFPDWNCKKFCKLWGQKTQKRLTTLHLSWWFYFCLYLFYCY